MTAEIVIMNKRAIAVAADSAITTGEKIYQDANKIFALSKSKPVGVMIYSSATYCGIPWDTIIKEYRRLYKDIVFNRLHSYSLHFLKFLKENNSINKSKRTDKDSIEMAAIDFAYNINKHTKKIEDDIILSCENDKAREQIKNEISDYINSIFDNIDKSRPLKIREKINSEIFFEKFGEIIDSIYEKAQLSKFENIINDFKQRFFIAIYQLATNTIFATGKSGVVIFGFGEKDIYPEMDSYEIGYSILGKVQINHEENCSIDEDCDAILRPYAQDEIIHMFINGIHPQVSQSLYEFHVPQYNDLVNEVCKIFEIDDNLKESKTEQFVELLDKAKEKFVEKIIDVRREFWNPTMYAIAAMTPTEIGNLAESLINITSLHNHVTDSKETVGGPTDVAIISKGDGFIWIKRKQYFKPELNPDFFKKN